MIHQFDAFYEELTAVRNVKVIDGMAKCLLFLVVNDCCQFILYDFLPPFARKPEFFVLSRHANALDKAILWVSGQVLELFSLIDTHHRLGTLNILYNFLSELLVELGLLVEVVRSTS